MSARFSKSPSPVGKGVTCLEVELLWKKRVVAEVKELWRKEAEEARCWEEGWKAQEEARRQEEEVKWWEEEEEEGSEKELEEKGEENLV